MELSGQRPCETVQVGRSCSPTATLGGQEKKLQPLSPPPSCEPEAKAKLLSDLVIFTL